MCCWYAIGDLTNEELPSRAFVIIGTRKMKVQTMNVNRATVAEQARAAPTAINWF